MKKIILTVIGASMMLSCSTMNKEIVSRSETLESKPIKEAKVEQKETPSWVSNGSGVSFSENHESKDAFFGVGGEKYIGFPGKVKVDADDAARNSLIRVLDHFNKGLIRYHQAVKDPREQGWIDKEKLLSVINDTASISLLDTNIVDHWDQSDSRTSFSLARLDFKKVQTALVTSNHLKGDEKTSMKFISKWVFKNMQLVRERKFLFSKMKPAITIE